MWIRRIVYVAALIAALMLQIFNDHYLAQLLVAVLATAPVLSLLLSLPAIAAGRYTLYPAQPDGEQGGYGKWTVTFRSRVPLPVARARIKMRFRHGADLQKEKVVLVASEFSGGDQWEFRVDTPHCEILEGKITRVWVSDLLCLVSVPLPGGREERMRIVPEPEPPEPTLLPKQGGGEGEGGRNRNGAYGEEYELRDYRPGDPLRLIHWKLSSKREKLVTREMEREQRSVYCLTLDRFGPPEEQDRTFARLLGWAELLLGKDLSFYVQWVQPVTGELRSMFVSDRRAWEDCFTAVLSEPPAAEGASVLDLPLAQRRTADGAVLIHISGKEEKACEGDEG